MRNVRVLHPQRSCSEIPRRERAFTLASARILHNVNTTHTRTAPMACTDAVSDVNNALHKADDEEAPVITLEYGPYMN